MSKIRAHIRYEFSQDVEYVLDPKTVPNNFKGKSIDISDAGLGLYVFNPLNVGQEITIKSGICLKGTVRWCNELGDNVYRMGLQFIL